MTSSLSRFVDGLRSDLWPEYSEGNDAFLDKGWTLSFLIWSGFPAGFLREAIEVIESFLWGCWQTEPLEEFSFSLSEVGSTGNGENDIKL